MAKSKFNGTAKWIIIIIAIATIIYNSIATHVLAKNEMKHIQINLQKLEDRTERIENLLIEHISER